MAHLIDKDTLVAEINKRIIDAPINNIGHQRVWAYNDVKDIINTLKMKEADLEKEPASDDLEQASKEWLRPQLDKSYANYGEKKMMELTRFDGYAMLDAIEFGAQWQKEQMIKGAVIGPYIRRNRYTKKNVLNNFDLTCDALQKFIDGQKLKVIFLPIEKEIEL